MVYISFQGCNLLKVLVLALEMRKQQFKRSSLFGFGFHYVHIMNNDYLANAYQNSATAFPGERLKTRK